MTPPTGPEPLAAFRAVSKSYDGRSRVVDALDLEIERGEFVTLLGPSGSGKTTILMMLAGFEEPSGGTLEFEGRSLAGVAPHRRDFGVVFQNYALFPHLSVAENLAFPLRMRHVPRAKQVRRVQHFLDMVRLGHLAHRRPAQLSGGQRQRVALARALIFGPRLVLLDEPLGALDRQLRIHLQAELRNLHRALGFTVIHITHDQEEALALADRLGVIESGRLLQFGSPAELYDAPADPFVAGFLGENNRLVAVIGEGGSVPGAVGNPLILPQRSGADFRPGTPVTVMVRPEHVTVTPHAAGGPLDLPGRVVELSFRGDHMRIGVDIPAAGRIFARQSHAVGMPPLVPGDSCFVNWPLDRAKIFPYRVPPFRR